MKFFCLILAAFLISCTNSVTFYNYNGTTITRVDKDGEIRFYYGDLNDEQNVHPYIKAEYSGFNSSVDALLRFNADKTVDVIRYGGGYFTESDVDNHQIHLTDYENPALDSLIKSYRGVYTNIIRVSDIIEEERRLNYENHSQVHARYP